MLPSSIERAKGDAGLIITGLLPVGLFPEGKGPGDQDEGFHKDVEQQKYLADGVHQYDSECGNDIHWRRIRPFI